MPCPSNQELPSSVRHVLPEHAQDICRAAFNSARAAHAGEYDVSRLHRIAWAAVKHRYENLGGACLPRR